jgi:hypothetical protein
MILTLSFIRLPKTYTRDQVDLLVDLLFLFQVHQHGSVVVHVVDDIRINFTDLLSRFILAHCANECARKILYGQKTVIHFYLSKHATTIGALDQPAVAERNLQFDIHVLGILHIQCSEFCECSCPQHE